MHVCCVYAKGGLPQDRLAILSAALQLAECIVVALVRAKTMIHACCCVMKCLRAHLTHLWVAFALCMP